MDTKTIFQELRDKDNNHSESLINEAPTFKKGLFKKTSWYFRTSEYLASESVIELEPGPEMETVTATATETETATEAATEIKTKTNKEETKKYKIPIPETTEPNKIQKDDIEIFTLKGHRQTDNLHFLQDRSKFSDQPEGLDLLFLGERPKNFEKGDNLLNKMIAAMNLNDNEYAKAYIDKTWEDPTDINKEVHQIYSIIGFLNPKMIISLGAVATNILLRKKERLSLIHGEVKKCYFQFEDERSYEFDFIPVFHPDLLFINPNMKRSAWKDLQKVLSIMNREII